MFFMIFPILCPTQRKQFRMFHSWQWYDKKTVELSRRPSCKLVYFTGKKSLELLPFEVRVLPPKLNKQWAKYFSGLEEFIWWQIFHVVGERERERESSPSGVVSTSQTWDKWWQSFTNIGIVSWTQHWELQLPAMLVDIKSCWSSSARTVSGETWAGVTVTSSSNYWWSHITLHGHTRLIRLTYKYKPN